MTAISPSHRVSPPVTSTEGIIQAVSRAVELWKQRNSAYFLPEELHPLLATITRVVTINAPKLIQNSPQSRSIFLPKYNESELPLMYLIVNNAGRMFLFESSHRFSQVDDIKHSYKWSRKIAERIALIGDKINCCSGFRRIPFPVDWSTIDSPVIHDWCSLLAQKIQLKALSIKSDFLTDKESSYSLAAQVFTAIRPMFLEAFQHIVFTDVSDYRPQGAPVDHVKHTPFEQAALFMDYRQRQALTQWLFTAPCFANSSAVGDRGARSVLSSAVAAREPFIAHASKVFLCPPPLISRLRACPIKSISVSFKELLKCHWREHPTIGSSISSHLLVRFLAQVPLSNIPEFSHAFTTTEEYKHFSIVFLACSQVAFANAGARNREHQKYGLLPAAELLSLEILGKGTKGQWEAQRKLLTPERMAQLIHIRDMVQAVARVTILPKLIIDRGNNAQYLGAVDANTLTPLAASLTLTLLSKKVGLLGLLRISEAWHRAMHIQPNDSESKRQQRYSEWSPIIASVNAPNGYQIIALTNSAELMAEGGAMHHCVGGYSNSCQRGDSHILSIRTTEGERVSTLELQIDNLESPSTKPSVRIRQNHGSFNQRATPEANAAAAWLVGEINKGLLSVNWNSLRQNKIEHQNADSCGFNVKNPERWQLEFNGIRVFLPPTLSSHTPQEFLDRSDFISVIAELLKIKDSISANEN